MKNIQEFRNQLAHSVVDISKAALARSFKEGVGFVGWKDGGPVTDQEFEDWEVRAAMVRSTLLDIKRLLPFKEE